LYIVIESSTCITITTWSKVINQIHDMRKMQQPPSKNTNHSQAEHSLVRWYLFSQNISTKQINLIKSYKMMCLFMTIETIKHCTTDLCTCTVQPQ